MNCSQVQDMLNAFLDGELWGDETRIVQDHLAECPACAREFEALRQTVRLCRSLGEAPLPVFFHDSLMRRIEDLAVPGRGPAAAPERSSAGRNGWRGAVTASLPWLRRHAAALAGSVAAVAIGMGIWSLGRTPMPAESPRASLAWTARPGPSLAAPDAASAAFGGRSESASAGIGAGQESAAAAGAGLSPAGPDFSGSDRTARGGGEPAPAPPSTPGSAGPRGSGAAPGQATAATPAGASSAASTDAPGLAGTGGRGLEGTGGTAAAPEHLAAGFPPLRTFSAAAATRRPSRSTTRGATPSPSG